MISQNKKIIIIASGVNIPNTTPVTLGPFQAEDIDLASKQYDTVDYVVNVKSLTGGNIASISFQECFNDNSGADVYIEVAKITTAISAPGSILVTSKSTNRASDVGGNPMLGEGGTKQIVITGAAGITASNIDIYAVFTN